MADNDKLVQVIEVEDTKHHVFAGDFPKIDTYSHVDTDLLYEDDHTAGNKPFHITLPIAESGRVSANGLVYDDDLVSRIEQQMSGKGGLGGHPQKKGDGYYVDAVNWIGHKRVGNVLWGKGYIPPGPIRSDLRRKVSTGGGVGTSIYGEAVKEIVGNGKWKAKNFQLQSVDLAWRPQASLKMGGGQFRVTAETTEENPAANNENESNSQGDSETMTDTITMDSVPQTIKEQIIKAAQVEADAAQVAEMTERVTKMETELAETRRYASVVAEIRTSLGVEEDGDIVKMVSEMHKTISKLKDKLGANVDISLRVEEMHTQIAEMEKEAFETSLDTAISELTADWNVGTDDKAKARIKALHNQVRRAVVAELGEKRDKDTIADTAQKIWDGEEFKIIAESVRDALAGPSAFVHGNGQSNEWKPTEPGKSSVSY